MNRSKYSYVAIALAVILFIIPFFWLKPGEMDLGGDSNRLYFYDPVSYLKHHTPYNIVPTGIGGEAISYYALPFISLLVLLRLFTSATFAIALVNGIKLGAGFYFCFLLIKELLNTKSEQNKSDIKEISSILSALFYALSPILVNSGWEKAIFSHMQIFLNPLFFFLILKFVVLNSKKYLYGLLLLSFAFSMAFSYPAAPPFFAFYPLSLLFIVLYARFIRNTKIPIKEVLLGVLIFFLLQSFHLIPHILGILSFGSEISASVFSDQSKLSRGLDYFTAIAPSIKVSLGYLGLPQRIEKSFISYFNIVFPLIILLGFYYNKSKTLLLTGLFFLTVLFFTSANITDTGFFVYKSLFYIPGFKMFRNFFAQWSFTFVFFYTLLLSQSLVIVLSRINIKHRVWLSVIVISTLLYGSWGLLNGKIVNSFHHQSKKIKSVFEMDPEYEKVLNFIHNSPVDGKILTLPLAGPGYQVVSGKDEKGAYVGPSTFSYLAGKNDYTGYEGLSPFSGFFLETVKNKKYSQLERLFSILNVQYVFYNSDSKIYDDYFPYYPYDYVRSYMPNTQEDYKKFIQELPLDFANKIDFGDKFHLYPINNSIYVPHIYTAHDIVYSNKSSTIQFNPQINTYSTRSVFLDIGNSKSERDNVIIEPDRDSALLLVKNNFHFHRHEPFISRTLDDIFYPLALLREEFELWRRRNDHDKYLDFSLFYSSKRILELGKFDKEIPISIEGLQKHRLWEFYKWKDYNAWNTSIERYHKRMNSLIDWVNANSVSESRLYADKLKINEQLNQHKVRLIKIINNNVKTSKENNYLLSLINKTIDSLVAKLDLKEYDASIFNYKITVPRSISGKYNVFVQQPEGEKFDLLNAFIQVENQNLNPISTTPADGLIQFQDVFLSDKKEIEVALHLPQINLATDFAWEPSGQSQNIDPSSVSLTLNNVTIDASGGLTKKIPEWKADKQYIISFDYKTFGDDLMLRLYDKRLDISGNSKLSGLVYFDRNLNSTSWKKTQVIIHSDINTLEAYLQIIPYGQKKNIKAEIKNLSMIEVDDPKIFFYKINPPYTQKASPHITFRKINLTKYEIQVVGATDPYTLVFSEAYSKHWKLFDKSSPNTELLNKYVPVLKYNVGLLGKLILSLFVKGDSETNRSIIGSYFNGEIKEEESRTELLNLSMFDSWGKKTVAYNSHFRANGYANTWYITPQDVNGKTSYILVLEMGNQRYFYVFFAISLITVIFLFLYFIAELKKNEKIN